jgi:hypothetical protein
MKLDVQKMLIYVNVCMESQINTSELFNPLNSELNFICHLLILLGNLKIMGTCIVSIL